MFCYVFLFPENSILIVFNFAGDAIKYIKSRPGEQSARAAGTSEHAATGPDNTGLAGRVQLSAAARPRLLRGHVLPHGAATAGGRRWQGAGRFRRLRRHWIHQDTSAGYADTSRSQAPQLGHTRGKRGGEGLIIILILLVGHV